MKRFLSLFSIFVVFGFSPTQENKDFTVISATQKTTYGGVRGSPIVTEYRIKLRAKRGFDFSTDSAHYLGKKDVFNIVKSDFSYLKSIKLKSKQELDLLFVTKTDTEIFSGDTSEIYPGSLNSELKTEDTKNFILFYNGGKSKCLKISSIKKEPTVFGM